MAEICLWCDEQIRTHEGWQPIGTPEGIRYQHWECALRSVVGGIGHLIAHEHWCTRMHDPDGGLTKRQSAVLCAAWVEAVGLPGPPESDDEPGVWEWVPRQPQTSDEWRRWGLWDDPESSAPLGWERVRASRTDPEPDSA